MELVDTPVAPFDGEESVGAVGAVMMVVKLHAVDQLLVPPLLVALIRQ